MKVLNNKNADRLEEVAVELSPEIALSVIIVLGVFLFFSAVYVILKAAFNLLKVFAIQVRGLQDSLRSNAKMTKKPPATFLLKIAGILPKRYRKAIEQEVSDMRLEYYEALSEKNLLRARCLLIGYYVGICWSALKWVAERVKELVGFMPKVN